VSDTHPPRPAFGRGTTHDEETTTMATGYVLTDAGTILVQRPAANDWGFELCDDDQSWPGGLGVAFSWTLLPDDDPRITPEVKARLSWLLDAD
jgi:hypothetical protein